MKLSCPGKEKAMLLGEVDIFICDSRPWDS